VSLSVLRACCPLPPGRFLVLTSAREYVDVRAALSRYQRTDEKTADRNDSVRAVVNWRMCELAKAPYLIRSTEKSNDVIGNRHSDLRLVAQCVNQPRYRVPKGYYRYKIILQSSHSGGYKEYYLQGYNAMKSVESQLEFRSNTSPPPSGSACHFLSRWYLEWRILRPGRWR
jgi:hypothetical protein